MGAGLYCQIHQKDCFRECGKVHDHKQSAEEHKGAERHQKNPQDEKKVAILQKNEHYKVTHELFIQTN